MVGEGVIAVKSVYSFSQRPMGLFDFLAARFELASALCKLLPQTWVCRRKCGDGCRYMEEVEQRSDSTTFIGLDI